MTSVKKIPAQELKQKIEDELIYTVCVMGQCDPKGQISVHDTPPFKPKWLRVRQIVYHDSEVAAADQVLVTLSCDVTQTPQIGVFNNYISSVSPMSVFKTRSVGSSITFTVAYLAASGAVVAYQLLKPLGFTVEFLG